MGGREWGQLRDTYQTNQASCRQNTKDACEMRLYFTIRQRVPTVTSAASKEESPMHPKKNIFAVRNILTSRLLIWSCVTNLIFCSIGFAQSQDTPRRSPLNEPVIATATRKLCVSANGKIARKGACARAEVEIANNKIKNKKIAVRKAPAGTSVLSSPAVTLSSSCNASPENEHLTG
jgi:hypothetical protein